MLLDTPNCRHAINYDSLVFYGDRNLPFKLLLVTQEFLLMCLCKVRFLYSTGGLVYTLSWDVMQCQDILFPAHLCCSFPSENNVITKVAEWKRPQVSF